MKKVVLIAGVNGFLGSFLARVLSKKYEIVGLVRSNNFKKNEFIRQQYSSTDLEKAFAENDFYAVLFVATDYFRNNNDSYSRLLETNLQLPVVLLINAIKYNVKIFINSDTFFNNELYRYNHLKEYTLSKKQCLEWLNLISSKSEIKFINMKLYHVYGAEEKSEKFLPTIYQSLINNSPEIRLTHGLQKRDFIHVLDVVNAFEIILASYDKISNQEEFEVGSGQSTSIRDVVELMKQVTNSDSELLFGAIEYSEGEIMDSKADNSALQRLGWSISTSVAEGIRQFGQIK